MNAPDNSITIATVNWYSCNYLKDLFKNLLDKAENPENINILIIDNTNGKDENIEKLKSVFRVIDIVKNNPVDLKGSAAHSSGLNAAMNNIKTPYGLILDPDVHIFKKNWDTFLVNLLNQNNVFCAGISYPPWQLGMYHNFPNPVFCFFKTKPYIEFSPGWSAYDVSKIVSYCDFLRRNILRLGILVNRRLYEDSEFVREIWSHFEKYIGVCSRDTGWRIAQKAQKQNIKTILFEPRIMASKDFKPDDPYSALAKYFELYCYNGEPILTHKYSTNSAVFKTPGSNDTELWKKCVEQVEKQII